MPNGAVQHSKADVMLSSDSQHFGGNNTDVCENLLGKCTQNMHGLGSLDNLKVAHNLYSLLMLSRF